MERERRGEEREFMCMPFRVMDEALKPFLRCLGLYKSSPSSSAPWSENHSEETTIMEVTTRKATVKPKEQNKQKTTPGKPGGVNKKPS
ncbi:PREDICTED: elicitor peptide 1-like [Tarenaya hassleriana]|uniref:elicitor peptide 1-like n=1 Tax=Tarenaya hassleriana TaxID=28532 RepID=UPI00053C7BEF|nr:PREDICTED: elicitor peptide 1-like [Tarenaya hassleriana]